MQFLEFETMTNNFTDIGPESGYYGLSQNYAQSNGYLFVLAKLTFFNGLEILVYDLEISHAQFIRTIPTDFDVSESDRYGDSACLAASHDYLFITGGVRDLEILESVHVYEFSKSEWETLDPMQPPRSRHSCIITPTTSALYVMGGYIGNTLPPTASIHKMFTNSVQPSWNALTNELTEGLTATRAVLHNDIIYVIGGTDSNGYNVVNTVHLIDTLNGDKVSLFQDPLPIPIASTAAIVVADILYCFGGIGNWEVGVSRVSTDQLMTYDLSASTAISEDPTVNPSKTPTRNPTKQDASTDQPTFFPTHIPTIKPTQIPSQAPSNVLTTSIPTAIPSESVTPTIVPTQSPSHIPSTYSPSTRYPTSSPTNPIKSVSLTTSNTVQNGASVIDLGAKTMDTNNNDWHCHVDDKIGFFLELSLDSSWGFHPTKVSNIQFTIHGKINNNMTDASLIVAFSVNESYFGTIMRPLNNAQNKITPTSDTSSDPNGTHFLNGDVAEKVAQNNDYGRKLKINSNWTQYDQNNLNAGYNNAFPTIYTLTNDPINNHLFVKMHNPSWDQQLWSQQCGFEAFGTNQGLQIYISPFEEGEDFTFTQFDVSYWFESEAPTISPSTSPTTEKPRNSPRLPSNPDSTLIITSTTTSLTQTPSNAPSSLLNAEPDSSVADEGWNAFYLFLIIGLGLISSCICCFCICVCYKLAKEPKDRKKSIQMFANYKVENVDENVQYIETKGDEKAMINDKERKDKMLQMSKKDVFELITLTEEGPPSLAICERKRVFSEGPKCTFSEVESLQIQNDEFVIDGNDETQMTPIFKGAATLQSPDTINGDMVIHGDDEWE